MTADGSFTPGARAHIYGISAGRCIGDGRTDITAQHRRARGMGGTSREDIGHPANGLPLCGSGTVGCHGWAERHPNLARLLGWRLDDHQPAVGTPFWARVWGWRRWVVIDGWPAHAYVDDAELDRLPDRLAAIATFTTTRLTRRTA